MELRDEGRKDEGVEFAESTDSTERQFEERLRDAMRRMDAPAGFAERLIARAGANGAPAVGNDAPAVGNDTRRRATLLTMPAGRRAWLSGALAAGMLGGVFWAGDLHVRRQRERAELVQRQFEVGMRITDRALEHARQQLQRTGVFGE